MAKTSYVAPSKSPKPAEIKITIGKFEDVIGTGKPITEFRLELAKKNPSVSVDGDVICVKSPRTTIRFTLASSNNEKIGFYPAGITFALKSDRANSEAELLGLNNFPQRKIRLAGQSLSITDNYRKGKKTITYKFSIVVQRGSDGRIGIIDPAISNTNSDTRIR